jgi:hypothetical protein
MKLLLMPLVVSMKLLRRIAQYEPEAACDCVLADVSSGEQEGTEGRVQEVRERAIERTAFKMWLAWTDGDFERARYLGDVLDHLEEMSDAEFLA